jgi:nicotinate-nucleotide pyrophosphorylase (carboxylating)
MKLGASVSPANGLKKTMHSLIPSWKKWILTGLEEDCVAFDWTARATVRASASGNIKANLIAKATGVWAGDLGLQALRILSAETGLPLKINSFVKDGETVRSKQKICEWVGPSEAIVGFERTFINLASYFSGIATQTRALVDAVKSSKLKVKPRITGTRKTLPGYRDLVVQSTLIGGAHPHRFNLSGGLLLKENHIAAAGGIAQAIDHARSVIPHLLKIEIEVRNQDELKRAIKAGAEVIMLDNFKPEEIKKAIAHKSKGVIFEVSGGINARNLDRYLIEGIDVISIGSITHSVTGLDLSLLVE